MSTERCDEEVFKKGDSVCTIDACMHRAEQWVREVARESGQRVDWHYSGGIANVLYLGDYARVQAAVTKLAPKLAEEIPKKPDEHCRCMGIFHGKCRIMSSYGPWAHGPYRDGDPLPPGVVAVDTH